MCVHVCVCGDVGGGKGWLERGIEGVGSIAAARGPGGSSGEGQRRGKD